MAESKKRKEDVKGQNVPDGLRPFIWLGNSQFGAKDPSEQPYQHLSEKYLAVADPDSEDFNKRDCRIDYLGGRTTRDLCEVDSVNC